MKKTFGALLLLFCCAAFTAAQDATAQPSPDTAQQQEEQAKLEKKAIGLLEQVVTDSQGLRLPENKIRVQIAAGEILWDKNPARARGLLTDAGAMLGQMFAELDRTDRNDIQTVNQLRQELVLTAGRHDPDLGYQLLRSTQPPSTPNNAALGGRRFNFDQANNLEQMLLATIAATDPKFAYQKAIEALDKGEFPTALNRILIQLQTKDADAFKKLMDKTLARLGSDSLLASREATTVAVNLLLPGPQLNTTTSSTATPAKSTQGTGATAALSESAYHDLMAN